MKWISHVSSEHGFGVRVPTRPPLIMKEINYRLFSGKDKQAVHQLWKTCKLIVPWNNPEKDILRKLSVRDDLFILAEINKNIIATAMGGYDGHRGYIYYLAVLPEFQKRVLAQIS